jgi:hypothetical protein
MERYAWMKDVQTKDMLWQSEKNDNKTIKQQLKDFETACSLDAA